MEIIKSILKSNLEKSFSGRYYLNYYRRLRTYGKDYYLKGAKDHSNTVNFYTKKDHHKETIALLNNPKLKHARIETTNVCNLNCIGCGTKATKRAKNFIDLENFKIAADALRGQGMEAVSLYTTGEPFLSKNLDELIEYLFLTGFKKVKISSNGQYPDRMENTFRKFLGKLHDARFSIDAAHQEAYQKIRIGGDINLIYESMRRLHKLNKNKRGFYFKISSKNLITKENLNEILDFFTVYEEWMYPEDHIFALPNNMGLNTDFEDASGDYPNFVNEQRPCMSPAESVVINWDGGVSPCYTGRDYHGEIVVGNVYKEKFEDIWLGKRAKDLRDTFLKNESGEYKKEMTASCCKGCFTIHPFANGITNSFIQYLYYKNKKISGIEGGNRIKELLYDLNIAASKKDNDQTLAVVNKHFK